MRRSGTDSDQAAVPAPWGGAPLSCVPAAHKPSHPQLRGKASTPLLPQRPQPAPARPPPRQGPGVVLPVGSEGQREATRHRGRRWRTGVKPAGRRRCTQPCAPRRAGRGSPAGRRAPGWALRCGCGGRRGCGCCRRRDHCGDIGGCSCRGGGGGPALPPPQTPGAAPAAPRLTAGPAHVTAGPTPASSPPRGCSAALRLVGEGVWQQEERPRGRV